MYPAADGKAVVDHYRCGNLFSEYIGRQAKSLSGRSRPQQSRRELRHFIARYHVIGRAGYPPDNARLFVLT